MSVKVMTLVWNNYKKGGSEKLALLALADYADDNGNNIYPSISTMAKKIICSESQARRLIHGFIDAGYISVIGNFYGGAAGQSRQYKLHLDKLSTTSTHDTPCTDATPSMDANIPLAPMRETPSTHDTQSVTEPSIEPSVGGKRISRDWQPSPKDIDYCRQKRPELNVGDIAEGFKDYWLAKAKDFKRSDWEAVWRTWVRRQNAPDKKTLHEKRSTTAQQMFGDLVNGNNQSRIIDISPADYSEGDRAIIPANGKFIR